MNIELTEHEVLLIREGLARSILAVFEKDRGPFGSVTAVVAELVNLEMRLDG